MKRKGIIAMKKGLEISKFIAELQSLISLTHPD